ncbi:unnamed protein product [Haemonchus placei]|uniref:Uncharacterized protein n=1 Tax=Haemonchus placei TaxID=6290 RepID=A0A0N4XA26_HAEPC|nr:unnamed protein product [Haemonchus placei]
MVGRSMRSGTSNVRSFWQASVADEERARRETIRSASSKPYSFPRWRSTDALSASLVASNNVDVPKDSRIPEQRLQKMKETERLAEIHKPPRLIYILLKRSIPEAFPNSYSKQGMVGRSMRSGTSNVRSFWQASVADEERARVQSSTYYSTEDTTTGCRTPSYSNGYEHVEKSTVQSLDQIYTNEEQLFMLYMKQNPEIMSSLGIACSSATRQVLENLPRIPVELRLIDDNNSVFSTSPRQGRYLKKGTTAPSNHIYSKIRKHEPREVHEQPHVEAFPEKRIGSLIKSEIKQLRKREDELHESRKELGLPTLQEMMELWKQGPQMVTLRSAARFDHPRTPVLRSSQLTSSNGSVDC